MAITRLTFRTLEARRFQDAQPAKAQQLRVDHNSNLSMVRARGDEDMEVEFAYTTGYGSIGLVKIEGSLAFRGEGAGEAAEEWNKTHNLPPAMAQEVHGAIMAACVPQAVGLAKDLRLPPPIPLPQVRFQEAKKGGTAAAAAAAGPDAA